VALLRGVQYCRFAAFTSPSPSHSPQLTKGYQIVEAVDYSVLSCLFQSFLLKHFCLLYLGTYFSETLLFKKKCQKCLHIKHVLTFLILILLATNNINNIIILITTFLGGLWVWYSGV